MEENLTNQSPEVEASTDDAPAERSIEEQLQAALGALYKERGLNKQLDKKAKELEKKQKEYEAKLAEKEQIASLWQDTVSTPAQQEQAPPIARRSDYADLNHQLATKQIVSGLQDQLGLSKQETEQERREKENIIIESKLFEAYVEAGGLLPGDVSLVDVVDPKYRPFEVIKALTKEEVKYDPESKEVLFYNRDGKVELNKHGVPITPREKMESYKSLPVFASSFKSENPNKGMGTPFNGKSVNNKVRRVTRADLSSGKVDPRSIIDGSVVVVD